MKLLVEVALVTAVISANSLCRKIRKEDISITKFEEEIAMGLLSHENVEEDTNENKTRSLDSDSFKEVEASNQIGNNVNGILKRRVRFTKYPVIVKIVLTIHTVVRTASVQFVTSRDIALKHE